MNRFQKFADAVHAQLDDATVEQLVGRANAKKHTQRRRIIWMRVGGRVIQSRQSGGQKDGEGNRVDSILTRQERISVQIFAESEDTLDTLVDNFIAAVSQVSPSINWEQGYEWSEAEVSERQPFVEFTIYKKLPVPDKQQELITITSEQHDCVLEPTE